MLVLKGSKQQANTEYRPPTLHRLNGKRLQGSRKAPYMDEIWILTAKGHETQVYSELGLILASINVSFSRIAHSKKILTDTDGLYAVQVETDGSRTVFQAKRYSVRRRSDHL